MSAADVVTQLFAAFARRDQDAIRELVDPACTFWPQGTAEAVGRTVPYLGHAGMTEFLADVDTAWERLEVQPADFRTAGIGVVCFGVAIGRPLGADDDVRIPVIWVFRLHAGRVVFGRAVRTAAEARELVGPDDAAASP